MLPGARPGRPAPARPFLPRRRLQGAARPRRSRALAADMLDFAIFAVTFLLILVGAVLYLYPVMQPAAGGGAGPAWRPLRAGRELGVRAEPAPRPGRPEGVRARPRCAPWRRLKAQLQPGCGCACRSAPGAGRPRRGSAAQRSPGAPSRRMAASARLADLRLCGSPAQHLSVRSTLQTSLLQLSAGICPLSRGAILVGPVGPGTRS